MLLKVFNIKLMFTQK